MEQTVKVTCVVCPLGCEGTVNVSGDKTVAAGFTCPRGERYAVAEVRDPHRMLTTTVRVRNGKSSLVPVVTSGPVPKSCLRDAAGLLAKLTLQAPVSEGQLVYSNLMGTGINVIAVREVGAVE